MPIPLGEINKGSKVSLVGGRPGKMTGRKRPPPGLPEVGAANGQGNLGHHALRMKNQSIEDQIR